jgi:hypothetical protein
MKSLARVIFERRGRRYPARVRSAMVSASLRLPCAARTRVAPCNSLRSLRSLRSNRPGESDHEARWCAPTLVLRCSASHHSPLPGTACRAATAEVRQRPRFGHTAKARAPLNTRARHGGGRACGVRGCDRRDHSRSPWRVHEKNVLMRNGRCTASGRPRGRTGERTPGPRAPRWTPRPPASASRCRSSRTAAPGRSNDPRRMH